MSELYHDAQQLSLFSVETKFCPTCNPPTEKSLDEFYLYKNGTHDRYCKACTLAKQRAYYARTREDKLAKRRVYRADRMEQEREIDHRRHERSKEKRNAVRRTANLSPETYERRLIAHRANYYVNKDHRANRSEYHAQYRETHTEQISSYEKQWRAANPLKNTEKRRRRTARIKQAQADAVSYEAILAHDGYICHICNGTIDPHATGRGSLNFDHVIPLYRGGKHSQDNIKPSHRVCNFRKGRKLMEELTAHDRRGL